MAAYQALSTSAGAEDNLPRLGLRGRSGVDHAENGKVVQKPSSSAPLLPLHNGHVEGPAPSPQPQAQNVGCLFRLAQYFYRFGGGMLTVTHTATFDVPVHQASEICKDYRTFLSVMLQQPLDNFKWVRGGAGEVGAVLEYPLLFEGLPAIIQEEIVHSSMTAPGTFLLSWKNVSTSPPLPLGDYGCDWELAASEDGRRTRLTWTRHWRQVYALGVMPFGSRLRESFVRHARPILWTFKAYYASNFPKRLPQDRDARILIVGAGPSGLHMAFQLQKRGYRNITIFERTGRYGGKTLSVPQHQQTLPQGVDKVMHELGTCYLSPAYFGCRALFQELRSVYKVPQTFEEVGPDRYSVDTEVEVGRSLEAWAAGSTQPEECWALPYLISPVPVFSARALLAMQKYTRLHRELLGMYSHTMPLPPSTESLQLTDMSFLQFLQQNGLDALVPLLGYGMTCQGYGSLSDVPAYWGLTWITPELLDGYFALPGSGRPPRKSMLTEGWISLWDAIVGVVGKERIRYHVEVRSITRTRGGGDDAAPSAGRAPAAGGGDVRVEYAVDGGALQTESFDFLVVAAPLHLGEGSVLDLTEKERQIFSGIECGQFRTVLYRTKQAQPFLHTHLTLYPEKFLGAEAGKGDVFAFRDSYLARFPELNRQGAADPARLLPREQMCYQYATHRQEEALLRQKFREWIDTRIGAGNYEVLMESTWDYFYRYGAAELQARKPWQLLGIQGENHTLYAHASACFESVEDIVSYQNMLLDSLQGKTGLGLAPTTSHKPQTLGNGEQPLGLGRLLERCALDELLLGLVGLLFNLLFKLLWVLFWPLNQLIVFPLQRWILQWAFRTPDLGCFLTMGMSKFIRVSPTVACLFTEQEDRVVTDVFNGVDMKTAFPFIGRPRSAMQYGYADYRVVVREWIRVVEPRLPQVPSIVRRKLNNLLLFFPRTYNLFISAFTAAFFTSITGYGYHKHDEQGGGFFVPECTMLAQARKEYPEEQASRICTHVCKIFSEETMRSRGIAISFEPNMDEGSCMVRGRMPVATCCADNRLLEW